MPSIIEIPKGHKDAFHLKHASVMDIISTVDSPSHWRYFKRKEDKKQSFLNTLKVGPFIAGNSHEGFGNTVAFAWKNKRVQKTSMNRVWF